MTANYQMHEIEAYFGEHYAAYEEQVDSMLDELPWSTIEHYMDDEIREELHGELAPCSNRKFLLAYMMAHTEKYGEDFAINLSLIHI